MFKKNKIRKIFKKAFALILLVIMIFNNMVCAIGDNSYQTNFGDYRIYSRIGDEKYIYYDGRIQTNFEYYYLNGNGVEMPAYCLNLGVEGAEKNDEYYVNVSDKINDNILASIILNGYPYKSAEELGVENEKEARFATQFAIWVYLTPLNLDNIVPTSHIYQRVVNAIRNIYIDGISKYMEPNNIIKMQAGKVDVDSVDNNYLSTAVHLDYNNNVKDIQFNVRNIEEYKLVDNSNKEINDIYGIHNFKILIPRNIVLEDKNLDINIEYNTKQTAVMFGTAKIPGMQNVSVILEPITHKSINEKLDLKYLPVNFEIIKLDKDNETIKIPNVKFKIYNMEDKFLGEYTTDENGEIKFDILKELNIQNGQMIKIQEVEVSPDYYIDKQNDTQIIQIDYDKTNKVIFKNEKIKGRIKVIKTSSEYNELNNFDRGTLLKDAVFEIYDANNKLVQEITTNEKGEALSMELLKGKYYIKEKKSPKHYVLDDKLYEVNINEHKKTVILNIKNGSEKKVELPKTGY